MASAATKLGKLLGNKAGTTASPSFQPRSPSTPTTPPISRKPIELTTGKQSFVTKGVEVIFRGDV